MVSILFVSFLRLYALRLQLIYRADERYHKFWKWCEVFGFAERLHRIVRQICESRPCLIIVGGLSWFLIRSYYNVRGCIYIFIVSRLYRCIMVKPIGYSVFDQLNERELVKVS